MKLLTHSLTQHEKWSILSLIDVNDARIDGSYVPTKGEHSLSLDDDFIC